MRAVQQFEGFATTAEAAAQPYHYVPFIVPSRCTRIEVSYQFASDGDGPCSVDIGIFDIRGTQPVTGGFRGWSGADRRTFYLTRDSATPGYIGGVLPAGTWSVILGLYEVPLPGVRWWLTIDTESSVDEPHPLPSPAVQMPLDTGEKAPRWVRGDLHSHSEHSDGANTIAEIATFAKERKLDFLAITDHNTITHQGVIDGGQWPVLLVPGEEVTTYQGHANVWGLREWVDFRVTNDAEMHRLLKWVEARGRPFSMNHPKTMGPPWVLADPGFAIREVWQAPWRWYNWESVGAWDEQLATGRHIIPVGGSDAHSVPPAPPKHPHNIGDPTTWLRIEGDLTEQAVIDAITAGRTSISDSPEGPFVALEGPDAEGRILAHYRGGAGCDLVFITGGEVRHRVPLKSDGSYALPTDVHFEHYLRAEIRSEAPKNREDTRALSAPIYVD